MKYVKYLALFIMVVISTTIIATQASAHSPRYMKLKYSPDELKVIILHFTFAPKIHYIYKVDIEKNGQLVNSELYQSQQRLIFVIYKYNLTASSGDQITVTAYCSLFGKITRSITVT
jgi:hypothetical protein